LCGLKLWFLCTSIGSRLPVGAASADLLLTVSPFVARLVEELATDMANGGTRQMHELIAGNGAIVGEALDGFAAAALADGGSRVSVARVELAEPGATRLWGRLLRRGIHTVP
jgi:hypothetical protein